MTPEGCSKQSSANKIIFSQICFCLFFPSPRIALINRNGYSRVGGKQIELQKQRVKVGLSELIKSSGAGLFLQIQSRERESDDR